MNQKEFFGVGSVKNILSILQENKSKKLFLVTGKNSFESCGAEEKINILLSSYNITYFNDFSPNPKLEEINKGLLEFKRSGCEIIAAIGGGSTIDVAKAIKLFFYKESNINIPLIAVPTTTGTGSEATYFIVYYIGKEKQSIGDPAITLPDYSILDPQFIFNLPKKITADTGIDALAQAIESHWSIYSTVQSKKYSTEAIKLIFSNLEKAVNTSDKKSKENMLLAANLSGKAINITKTTACHSIAYPITSFFNIPHGHAVGLTLSNMLLYNSQLSDKECNDPRGADYVMSSIQEIVALTQSNGITEAKDKIEQLMRNIGLETRLSNLGLSKADIDLIIQKGFNPDRVKNNPRVLTSQALKRILENIY